jgi:hypothetical protein
MGSPRRVPAYTHTELRGMHSAENAETEGSGGGRARRRSYSENSAEARPVRVSEPYLQGSPYGRAALERDLAKLEWTHRGRHVTLFHVAANAGALVAGGELDETSARVALEAAARRVGLSESELRRTVRDAMRVGGMQPRSAPRDGEMIRGANQARVRVQLWWERAQADPVFATRRGATTLKILGGFYLLAARTGKVRLVESYREVAEAAGVSVGTISKHEPFWSKYVAVVQKGSRFGRARVETSSGRTNRSVFQLLVPGGEMGAAVQGSGAGMAIPVVRGNMPEASLTAVAGLFPSEISHGAVMSAPRSGECSDPGCDIWQRWGSGWRLWTLLDEAESCTAEDLAVRTGSSVRTVRNEMTKLVFWGVAGEVEEGSFVRVSGEPPAMPVGYGVRRRSRHRVERELFSSYLAARFGSERQEKPVVAA